MPTRLVREGINSSDRINALSDGAEILYRRLMSVVDDYGRFYASPATLRGACWPTNPERVREAQVMEWLQECAQGERPLIKLYYVGNCKYLELQDFGQQVRSKSKFPDPCGQYADNLQTICKQPDNNLLAICEQTASNPLRNVSTSRSRNSESKTNAEADKFVSAANATANLIELPDKPAKEQKSGTRFSEAALPDKWAEWAEKKYGWSRSDCQSLFEQFSDYWTARATKNTSLDWFASWRTWCRNEGKYMRAPPRSNQPQYESATDRAIKRAYELHGQGLL